MVAISYTMAFFDLVSRFGRNAYEKSYQIRLGRYRPFKTNCVTLFGRFDNRDNAHRSCVAKDVNHFFVLGHFFKEGGGNASLRCYFLGVCYQAGVASLGIQAHIDLNKIYRRPIFQLATNIGHSSHDILPQVACCQSRHLVTPAKTEPRT